MIPPPVCVLYTQDPDLSRRVRAFLRAGAQVRHVSEPDRLDAVLEQADPCVLIADLRAKECRDLIEQTQEERPNVLIIALGVERSEPLREAEHFGIYAAEDVQLDRRRFQALTSRAFAYLKALQENRDLRETSAMVPVAQPLHRPEVVAEPYGPSPMMMRLPRVFRRLEKADGLLGSIVEGVADAAGVARVGIFYQTRQGEQYRLRAGLRCLPETHEMEFGERDALVRWLESHAFLIARANLSQTADQRKRQVMRRALDAFGAEVIVPLYTRGRVIGWLFFGHRITGQSFDRRDLEGLMLLAEQVSAVLENALLYQEVTLQKTLAETLLKSIPPGIVATDDDGVVRWFNPTAERLLGVSSSDVVSKPVETLGARLASFLRDALDSKTNLPARQWIDKNTRRPLSVEVRRFADQQARLGAVAVLHDLTAEVTIREKQALLDRATFWTDLAASMSHEIRNPLVAIKTFAQLLPERFEDADFRDQFNEIVVKEIDRLDAIITQINTFAHPPEIILKSIDVRAPVNKGVELAKSRFGVNGGIEVETSLPNNLPRVLGDEDALAEAFAHLVANAAEALSHQKSRRIALSAKSVRESDGPTGVIITVRDNGKGIAPELKEKVFSPFCTTKPRGMGLGLPIVKRTIFDHHGRVDIDSGPQGTSVSVLLPVMEQS
jgi:PAS domain S-box-containing protein